MPAARLATVPERPRSLLDAVHRRTAPSRSAPRLIARAKDMHYYTPDGRELLDGTAGLWCSNAGHNRAADRRGDPGAGGRARLRAGVPVRPSEGVRAREPHRGARARRPRSRVLLQFRLRGGRHRAQDRARVSQRAAAKAARTRLIGRERGYHGVGFGGISVGGIVANRKLFGTLLAGVDHLPATYNRAEQAFTKGEPEWGAHLADELERIVALHDASTIAAVIVEPMAGSTGVLPAPKGYLKRLRAICDKYGILLIFDEVITGFGRLGFAFAAERYGVVPDMITFAKGVTSGTVPMGGVIARKPIHEAFMHGPEHVVELFHGYTYSAHPLACAAGSRDPRPLSRRGAVRARQAARAEMGRRRHEPQRPAQRARHPHRRPHRRHRPRRRCPTALANGATTPWSVPSTMKRS